MGSKVTARRGWKILETFSLEKSCLFQLLKHLHMHKLGPSENLDLYITEMTKPLTHSSLQLDCSSCECQNIKMKMCAINTARQQL